MKQSPDILALSLHLGLLATMAVGGGLVMVAPEVREYIVVENRWLSSEQFASAFAIAQAAPGPNMLYVPLVGWLIAGWIGALAVTVSVVLLPTLITLTFIKLRLPHVDGEWSGALRRAIAPVSIGLFAATAWTFAAAANTDWRDYTVTLIAAVFVLRTKIYPVSLIVAGGLAGIAQLV